MSSIPNKIKNQLVDLASNDRQSPLIAKFADTNRYQKFSFIEQDILFDFSKTHISEELLTIYTEFAELINFTKRRSAFFAGEKINQTEGRSVLHTLLRAGGTALSSKINLELVAQSSEAHRAFIGQLEKLSDRIKGSEPRIKDLIHIGIGGSSLGTQLVYEALKPLGSALRVHFVSNIDAHQLIEVLSECDARSTLVFGISKTFTTSETLQNVNSVLDWMRDNGISEPINNLYAVTANPEQAIKFGIDDSRVIAFPEWVGGRYSVWSAVSISAAAVIGHEGIEEFLEGARAMDAHFLNAPLGENICFISAALDHYYTNLFKSSTRAVFAYDYRLRSLVPYLQQLETESNGKDRQQDGQPVDQLTSPVVWGGVGTDVQHSVFQMLHQGTSLIPSEFILVKRADHTLSNHHNELLANGIAQTAALLVGQDRDDVLKHEPNVANNELALNAKIFSGNKPSTSIMLERLSHRSLGALLAFYEHRTYCFGQLVNINSFDQMGVELGKRLAKDVRGLIDRPEAPTKTGFDQSTEGLLKYLRT